MAIDIHIGDNYPTRWSRREPGGLYWPVDISHVQPIRRVELSMEGDGAGPFVMLFPDRKDGRDFRGLAWKPEISGEFPPLVKAFETLDQTGTTAMQRGPHTVTVTEDPLPLRPPAFQIRAAFYYPWYPWTWGSGTRYTPTLGQYDSSDHAVMDAHIRALEYGGFHAAIASWFGPREWTDQQFPTLLTRSQGHHLKWALYYEQEGYGDPTVEQIHRDLVYIRDRYSWHQNYLRIDGKFVVFVYGADHDCGVATRWKRANTVGAHIVLPEVPGFETCTDQPDSWHQYLPTDVRVTRVQGQIHAYTISPGFYGPQDPAPRFVRDLARWKQNVRDMVASRAPWQLVISFNEFIEGTAIESSKEWASASGYGVYLDALHTDGVV